MNAEGRVIVATFASLISRVQQVVDAAVFTGRKVFVTGRSMIDNVAMARQLGYLDAPDGIIVGVEEMRNTPPFNASWSITTGSQGEPTSALTRMANGDHRHITIDKGDTVVLCVESRPGQREGRLSATSTTSFGWAPRCSTTASRTSTSAATRAGKS